MTRQPGLPAYHPALELPPLVSKAVGLTRSHDFPLACIPETGRLLQLCAALGGVSRACELGTAYGVGAAWIASGLRPGARLLTVEVDQGRAAAARDLFADVSSVDVLAADWSAARDRGPFDLLFSDGGPKRQPGDPEKLAALVGIGSLIVLDDYTPGHPKKEEDQSRRIWLESRLYRACEVQVSPNSSVILAVRIE